MSDVQNKKKTLDPLQRMTKQAQNHARAKRYEAAAKLYEKLAQREPQNFAFWMSAASSWREADKDDEAMRVLETAQKQEWSPRESARLYEAIADIHGAARRWDECVATAQQALELDSRLHMAREMTASALLQTGKIEEASVAMRELLQRSPFDPLHRLRYATLLQLQGRSAEALQEFTRVAQMHPDAPFAEEAREATEAIDNSQIQQILMMASDMPHFRQALHRDLDVALQESGFFLSEHGRESLKNLLSDGRPESKIEAPRFH